MKTICLDYDGTFTEFPELMNMIIDYGIKNNIRVILATMRYPEERDSELEAIEKKIEVFYTSRKAKIPYLNLLAIHPTIFIDDSPRWLLTDSI